MADSAYDPRRLYEPGAVAELRALVAAMPFPPVAEQIAEQAARPTEPAVQALLRAARDVLGDPGAAWDPRELQAIAVAPYDEALRAVVAERLAERWEAALALAKRLRGGEAQSFGDDAAALHLISVGLGLAMLAPISERWSEQRSWTALTSRLLESLTTDAALEDSGTELRWRARIRAEASPAAMVRLMRTISLLRVQVITLLTSPLPDGVQLVDLFLGSPADVDRATIVHGLSAVGLDVIVTRGVPEDAEDIATRVLRLSERLVKRPDDTPQAVADLVLADSWEVAEAIEGDDTSELVLRLQWTPEHHVVLRRVKAPFTSVERMRASALLALVAAQASVLGTTYAFGWREQLHDGRAVTVRLSRPEDLGGVSAMHDRCSEASRYQRYFTPMSTWREEHLRRVSGGHRGGTLVATDAEGTVIGLGNVFPLGPGEEDSAELAVIVDDAWHGAGVGMLLTEHLLDVARRAGFTAVVAYVLAENTAMRSLLQRTGLTWTALPDHDFGPAVLRLDAPL
jgi:RimJ/RimL family protein N-acetyltransferase